MMTFQRMGMGVETVNNTGEEYNSEQGPPLVFLSKSFAMGFSSFPPTQNNLIRWNTMERGTMPSGLGSAGATGWLFKTPLILQIVVRGVDIRVKLKVFDVIIAEGSEIECAMYTCVLIEAIRMKSEFDKKQEVDEWMKKYGDKTFEELMKMERDEEE